MINIINHDQKSKSPQPSDFFWDKISTRLQLSHALCVSQHWHKNLTKSYETNSDHNQQPSVTNNNDQNQKPCNTNNDAIITNALGVSQHWHKNLTKSSVTNNDQNQQP